MSSISPVSPYGPDYSNYAYQSTAAPVNGLVKDVAGPPKKYVVAVDDSAVSHTALGYVLDTATPQDEVQLLHISPTALQNPHDAFPPHTSRMENPDELKSMMQSFMAQCARAKMNCTEHVVKLFNKQVMYGRAPVCLTLDFLIPPHMN